MYNLGRKDGFAEPRGLEGVPFSEHSAGLYHTVPFPNQSGDNVNQTNLSCQLPTMSSRAFSGQHAAPLSEVSTSSVPYHNTNYINTAGASSANVYGPFHNSVATSAGVHATSAGVHRVDSVSNVASVYGQSVSRVGFAPSVSSSAECEPRAGVSFHNIDTPASGAFQESASYDRFERPRVGSNRVSLDSVADGSASMHTAKKPSTSQADIALAEATLLEQQGLTPQEYSGYKQMSVSPVDVTQAPSLSPEHVVYPVDKSDLPKFTGNHVDYAPFKSSFFGVIEHFPKAMRLRLLKECLDERSRRLIAGCLGVSDSALKKAFKQLDAKFGHPKQVQHLILAQITSLVNTPYHDSIQFSEVVSSIREWYDRLLSNSLQGVLALEPLLLSWMKHLPPFVYDKVSEVRYYDPSRFTFTRVLEFTEDWVGLQYSRQFDRRTQSNNTQSEICSSDLGPSDGKSDSTGCKPYSRESSGLNSRFRPSEVYSSDDCESYDKQTPDVDYNCNLCNTQDHKTVECSVSFDTKCLKALVQKRHICLVCGFVGHLAKRCPIVTHIKDSPLICDNINCESKPHSSRFCKLFTNK